VIEEVGRRGLPRSPNQNTVRPLAVVNAANGAGTPHDEFLATSAGGARAAAWNTRCSGQPDEVRVVGKGTGAYGAGAAASRPTRQGQDRCPRRGPDRPVGDGPGHRIAADPARRRYQKCAANTVDHSRGGGDRRANRASGLRGPRHRHTQGPEDRQSPAVAGWRTRTDEPIDALDIRLEATRLARQVLDLRTQAKANERQLRDLVLQAAPDLLAMRGVGPGTAAVVIAAWSHSGRVRSEAAFAALAGTCPIPVSSGNTKRHRLNRGGN
jgi:transposase